MINSIDVTIVIPCLNMASTVGMAVEGAVAQTGIQTEVIVVDDGSTDDSARAALAAGYLNVSVISLSHNQGVANALNVGAAVAAGRYLMTCGADDWIEPNALSRAVNMRRTSLDNHDGFVYGAVQYHGARMDIYTPPQEYHAEDFYESYRAISGYIFPRNAWIEGCRWRDGLEDWDHCLQLIEHGLVGYPVDFVLFNYTLREAGHLWQQKQRKTEVLADFKRRWPMVTAEDF